MVTKIFMAAAIIAGTLSSRAFATTEEPFFPTKAGIVLEYEHKDATGKVNFVTADSITTFTGDFNNGKVTSIGLQRVNNKEQGISVKKTVLLKEGEVIIDLASIMQSTIKKTMKLSLIEAGASETEMKELDQVMENLKIEGECRGIPIKLATGMKLPDYAITFTIAFVKSKIKCYNRKVIGQETINTEAGTFDCYIVEETFETKMAGVSEKSTTKSWYARGIGIVKEETYEKKKLVQSRDLISIL